MTHRTNTALLFAFSAIAAIHCGGPLDDNDENNLTEDSDEYVEDDDDFERAEPSSALVTDLDRQFEVIATGSIFARMVSRVELVAGTDCPTEITPNALVPWRCLRAFKNRHTIVNDVDVLEPETQIRFHRLRDTVGVAERSLDLGCAVNQQPNGHADLHSAGVRKFVLAGYNHPNNGPRRYDVLYRKKLDGSYRLLPARPNMLNAEWVQIKPNHGACIAQ